MNTGILASIKDITPVFLYSVFFIVFMLSLAGKIRAGLLFLTLLFPLQNVVDKLQQFPFGKDLNDLVLIAMILGCLFNYFFKRQKLLEKSNFNFLLFCMIAYTYFSLWQGSAFLGLPAPLSADDIRVQAWKNYIVFPLMFFLTANNIKNIKQVRTMLLCMIFTMFIMNYYTTNQIGFGSGLASRGKFTGTFEYLGVNEAAAFYATYTFVLVGIFLTIKEKIARLMLLGIILPNVYCILFMFSRGAYVATLIGACFISLLKKKILLVPLLVLLLFWQALLPTQVLERIYQTKTEEGELDKSAQLRIDMWKQSMELFKQNPIFGAGYYTISYFGFELGDTHNIFVKFLAEQGLIGTGILLMIFLLAFRAGWKLYRKAEDKLLKGLGMGFCACVIAMLAVNFFGDRWTHTPLGAYFWIFLGLVEAGNNIAYSEQRLANSKNKARKSKNELIKSL
jgi:O-antigen ligase